MAGPSLKGIVNPELLAWAREASRLDVETAAQKIGVAPEKLAAWEDGTAEPTITQLRKLADTYRRAVTFFFLERKPRAAKRLPDFRRLELSADDVESPELANMIREAQAKRAEALNIFAESEDSPPEFLIALDRRLQPEAAAASLRAQLGIEFQQQRRWSDEYQALRAWKAAAEASGDGIAVVRRIYRRSDGGFVDAITPDNYKCTRPGTWAAAFHALRAWYSSDHLRCCWNSMPGCSGRTCRCGFRLQSTV